MPKTILITGATDGIGLETARMLAKQGHVLLLHGRNQSKLDIVKEQLSDSPASLQIYRADLSDLSDVQALAKAIADDHKHLDILINNAGIYRTNKPRLQGGMDVRFMVNTIAPFALTKALLPIIPKDGRIINLSSAAQAMVSIKAMMGEEPIVDMPAYAQSKLAITMWTSHLAQQHPDGPLFVSVNPGSLLATKMVKEGFGVEGSDISIGADILCRAALTDEFQGKSGQYYDNDTKRFAPPQADGSDMAKAARITETIEAIIAQA
ncbi:MAG TPA: oxidoreductase [Rhizobiales bacterium]|nr:oxidoreductase [Hyphomicrobiales bacterium]